MSSRQCFCLLHCIVFNFFLHCIVFNFLQQIRMLAIKCACQVYFVWSLDSVNSKPWLLPEWLSHCLQLARAARRLSSRMACIDNLIVAEACWSGAEMLFAFQRLTNIGLPDMRMRNWFILVICCHLWRCRRFAWCGGAGWQEGVLKSSRACYFEKTVFSWRD